MVSKENHWNWKGGLPKCLDCGKQLKKYKSKRCLSCSHLAPERIAKLKATHKGKRPWRKGKSIFKNRGKKNTNWKGSKAGYSAIHYWVIRNFGKANKCENCNLKKKKYCWANKTGQYLRERNDWMENCYSCHKKYDIKNGFGKAKKRFQNLSLPKH